MAEEDLVVDLFGHPVVPRQEGRGRPPHVWTLERSNKVLLAFARGLSVKQAALVVGISSPTLRNVYFSEVRKRNEARLLLEMTQLARLNDLAAAGNISAEKELFKQMERLRQRDQQQAVAPAPTQQAKLGKKDTAAKIAHDVRGMYEPPSPPTVLN